MTTYLDHTYDHDPLGRSTMQTTTDHDEDVERDAGHELDADDDTNQDRELGADVEHTDDDQPDDGGAAEADDEPEDAEDTTTGTTDPEPAATATAEEPEDVTPLPAAPDAVTGIIRGLATTIPPQGTMLLAIARTADETVMVTIVPAKGEKETASAIPLVVRGTAEEIDRELVDALQHYVPARHIALSTAAEIARDTAAAAKKSQTGAKAQAAAKARTSPAATPAKKKPSLTIRVEPEDAALRVVDGADRVHNVKPGVAAELAKGRYIVTVTKPGYRTRIQNVVLKDGPESLTVALESDQMSLLGGHAA